MNAVQTESQQVAVPINITWPELKTEATLLAAFDEGIKQSLNAYLYGVDRPADRPRLIELDFLIGGYLDSIEKGGKQVTNELLIELVHFQQNLSNTVNAEILRTPLDLERIHHLIPLQRLLSKPIPGSSRTVLRNWLGKLQALCLYPAPAFTEQEKQWYCDQFLINWTKTNYVLQYIGLPHLQLKIPFPKEPPDPTNERELWLVYLISVYQGHANDEVIEQAMNEQERRRKYQEEWQRAQDAAMVARAKYDSELAEHQRQEKERQAYQAALLEQQQKQDRITMSKLTLVKLEPKDMDLPET